MCLFNHVFQGSKNYPFDRVLYCNVGDAHAAGQRPLTFVRQLLAACTNPSHMSMYPEDVVKRAKLILEHCAGNSIGEFVRERKGERERRTETEKQTDRYWWVRVSIGEFVRERKGERERQKQKDRQTDRQRQTLIGIRAKFSCSLHTNMQVPTLSPEV